MNSKTTVSDALDHMVVCNGNLLTWNYFKRNEKLFSSFPGKAVYKELSEYIHFWYVSISKYSWCFWLDWSKRFLLRLLKTQNYEVNIISTDGLIRPPVPSKWSWDWGFGACSQCLIFCDITFHLTCVWSKVEILWSN
jgi:hypothetical protein